MNVYTIGFTKKTAKEFFELLKNNNVKLVLDVRLNNKSQLAGFAKEGDLKYFLEEFLNIKYYHEVNLSPSEEILKAYKSKEIKWEEYEKKFKSILINRNIKRLINEKYEENLDNICLLCSEATAEKCHRRLVAEYIGENFNEFNINIIHL